jgi:hypothetical protein
MTPFEFLVFGLATWRVASLLVHEEGPWKVFLRLRKWAGIQHDEQGQALMIPDGFLAGILSCVWCCSMWVAAGWTILFFAFGEFALIGATVFGMSAVAVVVDTVLGALRLPHA